MQVQWPRRFRVMWPLALLVGALALAVAATSCTRSAGPPQAKQTKLTRVDLYGDPENLDPILKDKISALVLNSAIFEQLLNYDVVQKKLTPELATEWTVGPDGLTYTFKLRQGAKFHNGREIKADDVKYSFERLLNPDNMSPLSSTLASIKGAKEFTEKKATEVAGIKVTGPYSLTIELAEPDPTFLLRLTNICCSVVPKEEVQKLGADFGMKPVGSGPYKFDSWVKDSKVVLVANKDHWAGPPKIDVIETLIVKEAATRDAMFAAGQIDYMLLGDPQYLKYKNDPKWANNLVEVAELYTRHIAFNCQRPPFNNKLVRQAINYAIDRKTLVDTLLQGKAYPATGLFPPTLMGYDPELKGYPYDPEKAKALLKEAGYPKGFEFEVLCTSHPAWGTPAVEAIQPYLEAVGIKVKPVQVEWGVMIDRANAGDFQAYMYSVCGAVHPYDWLLLFHTKSFGGAGNRMRYSNPEVDRLVDQMKATTDEGEMIRLAREAQKIIVDDAPWWFFNYNKAVIVHQPWVKGLIPNPVDMDYQPLDKLSVEGKP